MRNAQIKKEKGNAEAMYLLAALYETDYHTDFDCRTCGGGCNSRAYAVPPQNIRQRRTHPQ